MANFALKRADAAQFLAADSNSVSLLRSATELIGRDLYRKALFARFVKSIVQAGADIAAGGAASFSKRCPPNRKNRKHGELSLMIAFQPKAFE